MTTFIVDSDIHFKHQIKPYKSNHVEKIIELTRKEKINAVICPGDLTDNGWDGKHLFCRKYGGDYDQLTPLKTQFVEPLEKYVPVYLCVGNHDYYVPKPYIHHGVLDYIIKKHGALIYSFDINDLHFICLGKYPDKSAIKFLKQNLHKDKNIIIYFHFNLDGPWSDWWTVAEKDVFAQTINGYNIIALLVGHCHISQITEWRGFKVVMGAAESFAKCTWKSGELDIKFI
jgi:predicted MPP superfamily phosphohydrolase